MSAFRLGKRNNPQPKSVRRAKQTEKSAVKIRVNQDQVDGTIQGENRLTRIPGNIPEVGSSA
jgi:hypothetical protein